MMHLQDKLPGENLAPLETAVLVGAESGHITVTDGKGRVYVRTQAAPTVTFTIGGAPGYHLVTLADDAGQERARFAFEVHAETRLDDDGSQFSDLLKMLHFTMIANPWGERGYMRWNGHTYTFFVRWLRDHVHVLKGMKYFAGDLKDGIDLYRDSQREDGMIWDNVLNKPEPSNSNHWSVRFSYDGFYRAFDDNSGEFKRIPVENDVEFLFVEGLYFTWKATGDDGWMAQTLDAAIRALNYSMTSPYRWSEKFQLLKRGYTIDTWDFQTQEDCLSDFSGWPDPMVVHPEKTRFGVMFGDNTGYMMACNYLSKMLNHAGRTVEAAEFQQRGADIKAHLDALSWNGDFYRHHVPEQDGLTRDVGVDEASQVSLSNAYSLNRGLTHEQAAAIIRTYQRIRANLPVGSPGEWYTIYPPFERGYGGHNPIWQYMNASVTPIVAGELAHGAFEHGFEAYGVDILRRLHELGKQHGNRLFSSYTGAFLPPPDTRFTPVDLTALDALPARELPHACARIPTGDQEFAGIPFKVAALSNGANNGWLVIGEGDEIAASVQVPVDGMAASVYLLHAALTPAPGGPCGTLTLHYADGSTFTRHVVEGYNVLRFNNWQFLPAPNSLRAKPVSQIGWQDWDDAQMNVQVIAYGLDNPHPERVITHIALDAAADAQWLVSGLTLSDQPVYFPPDPISYGIPNNWSAAAVVYALVEGLIGVVDEGAAYNHVRLSPRWAAADVDQVAATVAYPASSGYVSYRYAHDPAARTLMLQLTGSGDECSVHILLPDGCSAVEAVRCNGEMVPFTFTTIEESHYVDFAVELPGPHQISIHYQA